MKNRHITEALPRVSGEKVFPPMIDGDTLSSEAFAAATHPLIRVPASVYMLGADGEERPVRGIIRTPGKIVLCESYAGISPDEDP